MNTLERLKAEMDEALGNGDGNGPFGMYVRFNTLRFLLELVEAAKALMEKSCFENMDRVNAALDKLEGGAE